MKFETEAVIIEITKDESGATCRLKPVAEGTAIKIDGTKYFVGRQSPAASPPASINAKLWPLNSAGLTQAFELGESPNEGDSAKHGKSLEQWALAAWQAQRKVRVAIDVPNNITKITLL